jgi:SAM-dependent methyltransferase
MQNCTPLIKCLACGSDNLELTLDLGLQPLANNFLKQPGQNSLYPLAVNRCAECYHLQLTDVVDPQIIYKDYAYVSGTSQTYVEYMRWFADWTQEYVGKTHGTVLDIGCNDGTQLSMYAEPDWKRVGVDPAENLSGKNSSVASVMVHGFWDQFAVDRINDNKFDIVIAQNAFAHNPDPLEYLELLKPLLADDGHVFIQTSQSEMVQNGEFDTIYHEHVNFYNINSMQKLCERAGLFLCDVVKTPVHGNSYVFVVSATQSRPQHIHNLKQLEKELYTPDIYSVWATRAKQIAQQYDKAIAELQDQGYTAIGYGAAAKGNTFLNYVQTTLDAIIDDNELKQNTYSPGKDIGVVSMDSLLENITDNHKIVFVPLAWNFFDEIKARILSKRNNSNDKFIRYFPEVRVV